MVDVSRDIARELVLLFRGLRDVHRLVAPDDPDVLEPPAFAILARVGESAPLRLSDLAELLALDVSTVSRQLGPLERRGLVVRERDPKDGRAFLLRLTDQGAVLVEHNHRVRHQLLRHLLADWSAADQQLLADQLRRLNQTLKLSGTGPRHESTGTPTARPTGRPTARPTGTEESA